MVFIYFLFFFCLLIDVFPFCFRVLRILFHQIIAADEEPVGHPNVIMFVYTERSVVVLTSYHLHELMYPHKYSIIARYFANVYLNRVLGIDLV